MSWSKRLKHPSEVINKGDEVEAVVLNIDPENQRLSLGLKQLSTDVWDDFFAGTKVGDVVEGKVVRITNFGAFVELVEGIEGLIHVSEFEDQKKGEPSAIELDATIQVRVIKLSPAERKIGLSVRALQNENFEADWHSYADESSPEVTLGDHFRQQQEASAAGLAAPGTSATRGHRSRPTATRSAHDARQLERGRDREQHDQGGTGRGSVQGRRSPQETGGEGGRDGARQHR